MGGSLTHQSVPFTVSATKILFLGARNHHHGADMTLAAAPGDQCMKNILDIDAIGLHAPRPVVDL